MGFAGWHALRWLFTALAAASLVATTAAQEVKTAAPPRVLVLSIDGAIGPAVADYVGRGLRLAATSGAALVVLRIDTPGGLDTSMRQIIQAVLASPVPVAAFVGPQGARAASAGTFILYASHFAAMAPGTNLGAATPVPVGLPTPSPDREPARAPERDQAPETKPTPGPATAMTAKQVNDAAAYIRGLAQLRGRNADWAERAVREAASLPAEEALRERVVDLIAEDVPDLLAQLNGREARLPSGSVRLGTAGATVEHVDPDARTRFLQVITNPSVALVLMMLGIYGLIFEFGSPGFGLPGIVGAVCLLLALFAFQLLPVNYAGLALLALGVALMAAEAFVPGFGLLGAGGIVAFVIGGVLLFRAEAPGFGIPIALLVAIALSTAGFVVLVARLALRARRKPIASGREELIGAHGEVIEATGTAGWASIHGERWRVRSSRPLASGEAVRVIGIEGLVLEVEHERTADRRGTS